jgi:hypothetical protein
MKTWRPENWKNNYAEFKKEIEASPDKYLPWDTLKFDPIASFEDGANAMLEALRETGITTLRSLEGLGKEVYIPDDEPENDDDTYLDAFRP